MKSNTTIYPFKQFYRAVLIIDRIAHILYAYVVFFIYNLPKGVSLLALLNLYCAVKI